MDNKSLENKEHTLIEKAKYDIVWRDHPVYREVSPGEEFASLFFDGFKNEIRPGQTLLDFGCGTARVAKLFLDRGLHTTLIDISAYSIDPEIRQLLILFPNQVRFVQACLWELPSSLKPATWIYCCDVLEHIPPCSIDLVLQEMSQRMRTGGYLSICLQKDAMGPSLIGEQLHLTVQDKTWWEEKLSLYFHIASEDRFLEQLYFNCKIIPKK